MKNSTHTEANRLKRTAQFSLFIVSYIPLFLLIFFKQIYVNKDFIHFGGCSSEAIYTFFEKFGFSSFLLILSILGTIGVYWLFKNLGRVVHNGDNIKIKDVKNKNNEVIGYIATYIFPFLFQDFSGWYEVISFSFLMIIIYRIYVNSNLLIINPLLNFKYTIFELEYEFLSNNKARNALIITKEKILKEDEIIKIYPIGHKLYYAILRKI